MLHSGGPFGNTLISALIAVLPLLWIFAAMLKLKMPSHTAGVTALLCGVLLATLAWGMPVPSAAEAVLEGMALGLWPIIWVVVAAMFTYNLSVKSGAMEAIRGILSGISPDRRVQVLILAFAFGGFLEATAGFGTAVAIPAGMLAALGFEPIFAAVICLVANTVPVAFGVVGIPVITLAKITGLPLQNLSVYTALQLLPFAVVLPLLLVAITTRGVKHIRGVAVLAAVGGIGFGTGQTIAVIILGPELAATAGSITALVLLILVNRIFPIDQKRLWYFPGENGFRLKENKPITLIEGIKAWSPYIILLVLVLLTRLPALQFLSRYPFEQKVTLFTGPGGKPQSFSLLTNPGTLIVISAVFGGAIQRVPFKAMLMVVKTTLKQLLRTMITVLSIVALARVMGYSGMVAALASGLAAAAGRFYPFISPLMGAIGTFLTGSDTSSNVLFGELQKQTAANIGADPSWIAAANASGATAGKMVSPQSIAIATSAVGLKGLEGRILSATLKYAAVFVLLLGALVYGAYLLR